MSDTVVTVNIAALSAIGFVRVPHHGKPVLVAERAKEQARVAGLLTICTKTPTHIEMQMVGTVALGVFDEDLVEYDSMTPRQRASYRRVKEYAS